ncbi:MAG: RdgB/HAM1 family non-canonical purine NTP pyrophosphatase [Armatimonadetes bacterium]|nr:RdgB/HAM1 family non-canonical purine NTP pyrophosphatase [Armatimonadota bacterium]
MTPSRLLIATTNPHKAEEIAAILPQLETVTLSEVFGDRIETCPEDGDTFEANARKKAVFYAERSGLPTLADDSGIEVDALDGKPGVHSARWHGETTPYPVKNAHLLDLLRDVPDERRAARFVCVAAYATPGGVVESARGTHEGRIAHEIRGIGGFGYDPVFFSVSEGATFAEIPAERKNQVSHRARAMQAIAARIRAASPPSTP